MYLSRIRLSSTKRTTMRALADVKLFHEALENCFPGERPRVMWRLDKLKDSSYVLVLSVNKADLSPFCQQFSDSNDAWETKDYEPLLARLKDGNIWRFRLSANPTYCVKARGDRRNFRGKVSAHITTEKQKEWLIKKSTSNGFQLATDGFDVTENKWFRFYKSGKPVTILSVTYEGLLMITDVELFRKALVDGIGRGKAYGMGLLTVIRV